MARLSDWMGGPWPDWYPGEGIAGFPLLPPGSATARDCITLGQSLTGDGDDGVGINAATDL